MSETSDDTCVVQATTPEHLQWVGELFTRNDTPVPDFDSIDASWVAVRDHHVVGFAALGSQDDSLEVRAALVDQALRGTGIGWRLGWELKRYARDHARVLTATATGEPLVDRWLQSLGATTP